MADYQAQVKDLLDKQMAIQTISQTYNSASTNEKIRFDTMKAGIERLGGIGEALAKLTDQQTQQISS